MFLALTWIIGLLKQLCRFLSIVCPVNLVVVVKYNLNVSQPSKAGVLQYIVLMYKSRHETK